MGKWRRSPRIQVGAETRRKCGHAAREVVSG
jgi:hypothetical protein